MTEGSVPCSLGLKPGTYQVLEKPVRELPVQPPFQYKLVSGGSSPAKRPADSAANEDVHPSKKFKQNEPIVRVTSEGLKVISKDGSSHSQPLPTLTGPSKLSSNITIVPTVNGQPTQGHVFVINPQQPPGSSTVSQQSHSHMIQARAAVQTIHSANPELPSQKRVLRHVGQITSNEDLNMNGQADSNHEPSADGQQVPEPVAVLNSPEDESKETHAILKEQGIEVRVQDEGGGDPPGHQVIEQQHLLPGQVLQIQDENGQIIHMAAGEDGELVQVDAPEGGEELPTVEQHGGGQVHMQQVVGEGGDGVTTQVLIQENGQEQTVEQVEGQGNIYQTEDGLILIQNPDGSFQVQGHSDQQIPLDTVQALLAMDPDGQMHSQS